MPSVDVETQDAAGRPARGLILQVTFFSLLGAGKLEKSKQERTPQRRLQVIPKSPLVTVARNVHRELI